MDEDDEDRRIARIVRVLQRHTVGQQITRSAALSVFLMVAAKPEEAVRAFEVLHDAGYTVVEEPVLDAAPPTAAVRPASPSTKAPAPAPDPDHTENAALRLLDSDRWRRNPGSRILSAAEEVGLASLMRGSEELKDELPSGFRSTVSDGDIRAAAFDALVLHNIRLVHSLAQGHKPRGMEYEDVVQNGMIGLIRAVEKFDGSKGLKFSTYATWWIRQSITRGTADQANLIRLPVHMHEQVQKVLRAQRDLHSEGWEVSPALIGAMLDMPVEKVQLCLRLSRGVASLNALIGNGSELEDFVIDTDTPGPAEVVDRAFVHEAIEICLGAMPEREAFVIRRRFGIPDDEPATLDAIGKELNLTRERIRQIEKKALPKFRHHISALGLRPA